MNRRNPFVTFGTKTLTLLVCLMGAAALADHGGGSHTDFGLTVPATSTTGSYTVSWLGGSNFELQERIIGVSGYTTVYTGGASSKSFSGKTNGSYRYRLRLRVCGMGCWYLYSEPETVTVSLGLNVPSAITGPANDTDGTYTLNWGSVTGATSYMLQRRIGSGTWSTVQNASARSRSESGLADNVWNYRVRACNSTVCSSWTTTKTVNVARTPGVPGAISGPDNALPNSSYALTWAAASGADTYQLQRSVNSTSAWSTIQNTSSRSRNFSDSAEGTYFYRVRACNNVGTYSNCGGWTANKFVDVRQTFDFGLSAPASSVTGAYTVTWNDGVVRTLQESANGASWTSAYYGPSGMMAFSGKTDGSYSYRVRQRIVLPPEVGGGTYDLFSPTVTVQVGAPTPPPVTTTTVAGNLAYDSGVTKGGNAFVTIPITPVPGVNDLEPGLTIVYNSGRDRERIDRQAPGDYLGYGFSLSGFSQIRRCVVNQPDSTDVTLDNNDRLCLNGEPLVVTSGSYWQTGSEYRTLRESYHKVVLRGSTGTQWFEVYAPDGSVTEFGGTEDSRVRGLQIILANGEERVVPTVPYLWSINRQHDAFGNEMSFRYHKDDAAGVNHPREIVYGDNGDAKIEFEYVGRSDLAPVQLDDVELNQRLLLHTVRVSLNNNLVRRYTLASETTAQGWQRLNQLQLCGYDQNGSGEECLRPFDFDWAEPLQTLPDLKTYVSRVTDPQGHVTEFTQEIVTATGSHSFLFTERPFGNASLPPNTRALTADNGLLKSVVTEVRRRNGIGGWHRTRYAYHGRGLESTRNWGYLGFYGTRITDVESGVITYHQFRLDFPHFSETAATRQYDANFGSHTELLTDTETIFAARQKSYTGGVVYLPYQSVTTARLLEGGTDIGVIQTSNRPSGLDTNGLMTSLDSTAVVATIRQISSPAGSIWGQVPSYSVGGVKRTVVTERDYANVANASQWLIGFASQLKSSHYRGTRDTGLLDQVQTVNYTRHPGTVEIGTQTNFPGDSQYALTTSYSYDGVGNLTAETVSGVNVASRTTTASNFSAGRYPGRITNALNHGTSLDFDTRHGQLKTLTDPNQRLTSIEYDGFGREIRRTTPDNVVVTTRYDICGSGATCAAVGSVAPETRIEVSSPISPTTRQYLDTLGRVVRTEVESLDGSYVRRDVEYDAQGRVARVSLPYFAGGTASFVAYGYDIRDRVTRVDRADGSYTTTTFGTEPGLGVKTTTTDAVHNAAGAFVENQTKVNVYDITGELARTTDDVGGENARTDYAYYGTGRPRTITVDPTGSNLVTTLVFDDAGNRTAITGPDIGTVTSSYTALGQLRQQTDAELNTINYGYDLLGRLTSANDPDGLATWTYDPVNAIGALASRGYGGNFSETLSYDANARLSNVTTTLVGGGHTKVYQSGYAYESNGRLDKVTYPTGMQTDYAYQRGYLKSVTDTASQTVLTTYAAVDAFGNVTSETYGNGVATARGFDPKTGRLTDLDTTLGATTLQDHTYRWQSNGVLESRLRVDGGVSRRDEFDYDGMNRLKQSRTFVNSALTRTLDTDFDRLGNLLSKTSSIMADDDLTNYQYASGGNRLSSVTIGGAAHTLSYDANGSITRYDRAGAGDDRFIAWNARNLPVTVVVGASLTDPSPTAKDEFVYGPDGQRFYKRSTWTEGGATNVEHTFYVGSFEERLTDVSDPLYRSIQTSRIGDSVLHVKTVSPSNVTETRLEYLHRDHLGSVERVTDAQGTVLHTLAYDPYGERRLPDGTRSLTWTERSTLAEALRASTSRGYTGHEQLDRTGLVHMNGRIYDPQLGRFLSADPIVQSPDYSQSWNRYSYVMNSPLSFTDPSGYVRQPSGGGFNCGDLCMFANPDAMGDVGGGSRSLTMPVGIIRVGISTTTRLEPGFDFGFGGACGGFSCDGGGFRSWGTVSIRQETTVTVTRRTVTQSVNVTEPGQTDEAMDEPSAADAIFSGVLDVIPFVSQAKGVIQVATGRDLITGERVSRLGEVVGLIPGVKQVKTAVKAGEGVRAVARRADVPKKLPRTLRNKLKRINNQIAAGGNRGVSGAVSGDDALELGRRFVGPGFSTSRLSDGTVIFKSADGLRQFRGPSLKSGINPATGQPFSRTGVQVNFESRASSSGRFTSNVHLDVGN